MRRLSLLTGLVALILLFVPASARADVVRVFAAASLQEAFEDIAAEFRRRHPTDHVELHFGGSQLLRTQIEQGAPADVFVSADHAHMDALVAARHVGDSTGVCARNRLVVVVPAGGARVRRLADLARSGLRLVVANPNVPVGRYTIQVLGNMTRSGLFGADFQARVTANIVSQEMNVRAVLAKVRLGEADAGIVYVTDAAGAGRKVATLDIPDEMNVLAEYPIGVVTGGRSPDAATRFVRFVRSEPGQALLAKRGFLTAP